MSFASEVKKEITAIETDLPMMKFELAGILRTSSEIIISKNTFKIRFSTKNPSTARRLIQLLKKVYSVETELEIINSKGFDHKKTYHIMVDKFASMIIEDYKLLPTDDPHLIEQESAEAKQAFIRGAFLAKGSINDPKKTSYHLEILTRNELDANIIQEILEESDIVSKVMSKRNGYLVYIKEAEMIRDFLALIGANSGVFYFEDSRIRRDLNNSINRVMNCDIANTNKSMQACDEQLRNIAIIEENKQLDTLTPRIRDVIYLRKNYPESSLAELSELSIEYLGREISKSGLNHIFKEIANIALSIEKGSKNI
ncbi:MAG TPA: DNA-binding protein WhiA [Bacilli bacterium]|mgnify:CR=1 FL=1|nr:DNA-binding protein WhiA [Bacilli bacterium]